MRVEDIKASQEVNLRKDIVLHETDGFIAKLRVGTPLRLVSKEFDTDTRKIISIEFHVVGSFVSIKVDADKIDEYISDFIENLDNLAK